MLKRILLTASFAGLTACTSEQVQTTELPLVLPDACIHGASIYNSDASGLTVKDGEVTDFLYSNSDNACEKFAHTSVNTIDLKGGFIFPGFVDAHAHLLGIGLREMTLNLEGTASIKELQARVAEVVKNTPPGETVFGRGWIETHWPENRFPTRQDLDKVSPGHPVILERADGHAIVANSVALQTSGIDKDTKIPFGGDILLGKEGNPTGMLIDSAGALVMGLIGDLTPERKRAAYIKGAAVYAAQGWTGLHSMSVDPADIELIEQLSDDGEIGIRVYNAVDLNGAESLLAGIAENGPRTNENGRITTRAVKVYADGALGSRGAALLAPYSDDPENMGLVTIKRETILPILERSLREGLQISFHAIGDGANRLVLDWFEEALDNVPTIERKIAEPRWRVEHAQILNTEDIARFKELGIIASMQPSHAIGDLHFAVDRLGVERLAGGYAWRSLINNGTIIAGGSDAPVERGDPRIEFYASVARKDMKGFSGEGWYPDQKVSRTEAIKMFSEWPAYAAFQEDKLGKIEIGMHADFTVFDKNIMVIPEADILSVTPVMTIVDGEIVFAR